jgi:hypothetical protein
VDEKHPKYIADAQDFWSSDSGAIDFELVAFGDETLRRSRER